MSSKRERKKICWCTEIFFHIIKLLPSQERILFLFIWDLLLLCLLYCNHLLSYNEIYAVWTLLPSGSGSDRN